MRSCVTETASREHLRARLRKPASPHAVLRSLPVLFFGDIRTAHLATIGLNPSPREYVDKNGNLLTGSAQRFATLDSLGASHRELLTDEQCDGALAMMRDYFAPEKPVYGWFRALERVVASACASFADREAVHLDLVQEATRLPWSRLARLAPHDHARLLETDLPFLEWQLTSHRFRAVICTSRTASDEIIRRMNIKVDEAGKVGRVKWWVGHSARRSVETDFAGWNLVLARAGLTAEEERRLGGLLLRKLRN